MIYFWKKSPPKFLGAGKKSTMFLEGILQPLKDEGAEQQTTRVSHWNSKVQKLGNLSVAL